jgi:hypothetical protein
MYMSNSGDRNRNQKSDALQYTVNVLYNLDAVVMHCAASIILTLPFSHSLLPLMLW